MSFLRLVKTKYKVYAKDTQKFSDPDLDLASNSLVDTFLKKELKDLKEDLEHVHKDNSEHYLEKLLAMVIKDAQEFSKQAPVIEARIAKGEYKIERDDQLRRALTNLKLEPKRKGADTFVITAEGKNGVFTRAGSGAVFTFKGDTDLYVRVKKKYCEYQAGHDEKKFNAVKKYLNSSKYLLKEAIKVRNDPSKYLSHLSAKNKKTVITKGEKKLEGINVYGQLSGLTCPGKDECFNWCYALSGQTTMGKCPTRYAHNLGLAESSEFVPKTSRDIAGLSDGSIIRIHMLGDFYSASYAKKWAEIIKTNKNKKFYAYTKCFYIPEVAALGDLPNMKLIRSFGGKHDKELEAYLKNHPDTPNARVFDSEEELDKAGYTWCKDDDKIVLKPDLFNIGIVKHGLTPCAKGFCPMEYKVISSGYLVSCYHRTIPVSHLTDQIDLPYHFDEKEHDYSVELGLHLPATSHR